MKFLVDVDCPNWLHVAFLLCGFSGLRTEELLRMDWSAVLHDEQSIHVGKGIQKNSGGWAERYVDFTDPIKRRVEKIDGSGRIIPVGLETFRHARTVAAKTIGLQIWPPNCLRHSFASIISLCMEMPGKRATKWAMLLQLWFIERTLRPCAKVRQKPGGRFESPPSPTRFSDAVLASQRRCKTQPKASRG